MSLLSCVGFVLQRVFGGKSEKGDGSEYQWGTTVEVEVE
jgi:hypothetical protein